MIKKFELIAGTLDEVKEYIENLETFSSWQIFKSFDSQIQKMFLREDSMRHIGVVTYQGLCDDGVVIHATFVAITKPNIFLSDDN